MSRTLIVGGVAARSKQTRMEILHTIEKRS